MTLINPFTGASIKARIARYDKLWFGLCAELRAWDNECLPLYGHDRMEYLDRVHELRAAVGLARGVLERAADRAAGEVDLPGPNFHHE